MRLALTIPMFVAACAAFGQSAAAPEFELASIRPAEFPGSDAFFKGFVAGAGTCGKAPMKISGNRVTISIVSLCGLIRIAYDVQDYRVSGTQDWMTKVQPSLFYEIQAKAEGDAELTQERAAKMLQPLLADRFQLKLHRETKDLPVYNLVVAKGGHKLSTEPLPAVGTCGDREAQMAAMRSNPGSGIAACKPTWSTKQLADSLTSDVDRPVLDKTGLTGQYAFQLRFTPEGRDLGPDAAPSIFTAVQEQLGLKLEPAKEPLDFIVIDHAEPPSTN